MKKYIFVCTGATCRSPMASALLKHKLNNLGVNNVKVDFAGIMAQPFTKTNENTLTALKNKGVKIVSQKAKQLTKKLVTKNTTLLCLTEGHLQYVKNVAKSFKLGDFADGADIEDPYGKPLWAYEQCANSLDIILNTVANKIVKGEL